jgi:hypothetical protein
MKSLLAPVSLVLLTVIASISPAATHVVRPDGTGDFPTIQQAVDAAGVGDIVELTPGTFTSLGNRGIAIQQHDLLIRSQDGDPAGCTIDCQSADRGFYVTPTATGTRLEGITIAHGSMFPAGGGVYDGTWVGIAVTNCVLYQNSSGSGGGIAAEASPVLTHCRFVENSASFGGGFAGAHGATTSPVIDHCEFFGNTALGGAGGAIGIEAIQAGRQATVQHCTFARNTAERGGAITIMSPSSLIDQCTFAENSATGFTGAIYGAIVDLMGSSPVMTNCVIAFSPAGCAVSCSGSPTLACCDIFGNADGDWAECIAGQLGQNGNFAGDPLFCQPSADDFELQAASPCAPENNPSCGLIGALGQGCNGPTPTERTSWGRIKSRYR